MPGRLGLYLHTLRYLKPVQIHGRLRFRLQRPRPDLRPAPALRRHNGPWTPVARRSASMLGPTRFRFLNEEHVLREGGWDDPALPKLLRYNLHYFDDLNAQDASARVEWHRNLLSQWVRENPPATGSGWEPYPLSLRVVNWIKWALAGNPLPTECIASLAVQARFLSQRLEWHLLGNHLFANAKALVFAGLFFQGDEADGWLATGLDILKREVPEQILADGGQFERSTMYHALALEDMLDLINLGRAAEMPMPAAWFDVAARMVVWLATMSHPDDGIALFNDAAFGIAPSNKELRRYAAALGVDAGRTPYSQRRLLAESGYARAEATNAVLIIDVAPIGPDYLPGHAHADTLSFELSLFGQRLFTNGGTSRYGLGVEREAERGTAAHTTVVVDGKDSSEVWAGFRVARRARPFDIQVIQTGSDIEITGAHDGYTRLPGRPVHRRVWQLKDGRLCIVDRVDGRFSTAVARYHLHPKILCDIDPAGSHGSFRLPGGQLARWEATGGAARLAESFYCPEFGIRLRRPCLEIPVPPGGEAMLEVNW
jgi:uncharacterized heparinase superfamily protein